MQVPGPASAFSRSGKDLGIYSFKRHPADHSLKDNQAIQEEMSVNASIKFLQGMKFCKIWSEEAEQGIFGTHTCCEAYISFPHPALDYINYIQVKVGSNNNALYTHVRTYNF